jgi:formate dehydrogenase accessory protein FdhD
MNGPISTAVAAHRIVAGAMTTSRDLLAEEVPVAMLYNGYSFAVVMATPADLVDLAYGFSVTEGIVDAAAQLSVVDQTHGGHGIALHMHIAQIDFEKLEERKHYLTARSGCGLCGADSLTSAIRPVRVLNHHTTIHHDQLLRAFVQLEQQQPLNAQTGAVHAAAIIDEARNLLVREDVGRHNAVDKVIGHCLRQGVKPLALLVTSRASYEIVHKAAQVGIANVAAISAPTALAVRLASEAGISLTAFVRGDRLTQYTFGHDDALAHPLNLDAAKSLG